MPAAPALVTDAGAILDEVLKKDPEFAAEVRTQLLALVERHKSAIGTLEGVIASQKQALAQKELFVARINKDKATAEQKAQEAGLEAKALKQNLFKTEQRLGTLRDRCDKFSNELETLKKENPKDVLEMLRTDNRRLRLENETLTKKNRTYAELFAAAEIEGRKMVAEAEAKAAEEAPAPAVEKKPVARKRLAT